MSPGKTKYEPGLHPAIRNGFLFIPTAGMRLAPEVLVLEIFREIFFDNFSDRDREVRLIPNLESEDKQILFMEKEQSVLYALRGRKKLTKHSKGEEFYAPAYPALARYSWLRKKSDRVVRDFLFRGAIAQYIHGTGKERSQNIDHVVALCFEALKGDMDKSGESSLGRDILAAALRDIDFDIIEGSSKNRIYDIINNSKTVFRTRGGDEDELASAIYNDFIAVCELESKMPRMQWLLLLMSFLRIALPAYLLAHMRITVNLRDWIISALDVDELPDERTIMETIHNRNIGLFHPTSTSSREVFQHVENYMKARVEISILLDLLDEASGNSIKEKEIVTTNIGADRITILDLLSMFRDSKKDILLKNLTAAQLVTREGEKWLAWKNPLKKGQGKNYDEFFRVLYKASEGDDGGSYLLDKRDKRGDGFIVFPGHSLAAMFVILADKAKERKWGRHRKGKLILSDVEDHFFQYGIDFSAAAGARPRLIELLQEIGLLKGSPDAGDSVEVICPY